MMANAVCELLGIQYPIIEGGLAYVGNGALAAAVSEAGGFGQVGCGGRTPSDVAHEIVLAAAKTSRPFGVNIPISEHSDIEPYLTVIEENCQFIQAVSLSAGNPRPYIDRLHAMGLCVLVLVSTPEMAQKAEGAGADAIVCEGCEAGGHDGPQELTTLVLVPQVRDVVKVPVIAAGGIVDGRTAAAAYALGADGVQVGTLFVATRECQAHEAYKERLVAAGSHQTRVMERSLGRVTRVLDSSHVQRVIQAERETPGDVAELLPLISGRCNARAALEGKLDEGYVNCGQGVGLVKSIVPAGDVVRMLARDADIALRRSASAYAEWM